MRTKRDGPVSGGSPQREGNAESMLEIGIHLDDDSATNFPSCQAFDDGAQWRRVVQQIQRGDDAGMEELYRVFEKGIRFFFLRQLGIEDLDDKVHDTFVVVLKAIQRGDLREPERLMGFVHTVVRRQVAAGIDRRVQGRREERQFDVIGHIVDRQSSPEQRAAFDEKVEFMCSILKELSAKECDILTRFYLHEETQEQICREMNLSTTQFRLTKSRAKARFGGLGRRRLRQHRTPDDFGRISPNVLH
jgi:RNA polymerase sigma factor (sigma-70 family)